MKKLLLLLILSLFSAQSFAGSCPDGSDPVKSVSEDGTYFVYNCGGQSSSSSVTNSNSNGKVKVAMKPDTGDWISSDGLPMWVPNKVKWQLIYTAEFGKYYTAPTYAMGDFDGDGVDDLFMLGMPKQPGVVWDKPGPACEGTTEACFVQSGSLSVFQVEQTKTKWVDDGVENGDDWTSATYRAVDRSDLLINTNPLDMAGTSSQKVLLTDFNGDGKLDIFTNDTGVNLNNGFPGKNDMYFLSNEGVGWTESSTTHVTGHGVRNGKGLMIFSHGASVGDIDGDGDMDIVVTSIVWTGGNGANQNGEIFCYVNQGDGHMKVRRCGNQWGITIELGDIDNDGDLDAVFGGRTRAWATLWNQKDRLPGCSIGSRCNGAFIGILLNDGNGNFYQRGFKFKDEVLNSKGFPYQSNPNISVADLDGDGDLDVIRMMVQNLYAGAAMQIEENIGDGKFKTVLHSEHCSGPNSKAVWPRTEGNEYNCWSDDFKFGDFNKDGLIDIVIDRNHSPSQGLEEFGNVVTGGAVYMSTGKFTYDIVWPEDEGYPLIDMKIKKKSNSNNLSTLRVLTTEEKVEVQAVLDELAEFEAELEEELAAEAADAIAKRKAKVAAAKAKRIAEEEAAKAELAEENKSSPLFDGRYSFNLFRYHDGEDWQELGNGFVEIMNGEVIIDKDNSDLKTGSNELYDTFSGQIDEKGNVSGSVELAYLFGKNRTEVFTLNGQIDKKIWGDSPREDFYRIYMLLVKK